MTPQERQLVSDLFDRLAKLEQTPRETDAERAIADGLAHAPNAIYPLVQTVLVQDEALRRADARIRELEGSDEPAGSGFLDNMRSALFGGGDKTPTSVPSIRQNASAQLEMQPGAQSAAPQGAGAGSSFLGTAAASAVGVIGGAMMFNMIGSLFGGSSGHGSSGFGGQAFASQPPSSGAPWDQSSANSELARDAGLGDIAGGQNTNLGASDSRRAGLFDSGGSDGGFDDGIDADFGGDFGAD